MCGIAPRTTKLTVRLDPRLYGHVLAQSQGPRAYLEGLVSDDMSRTQPVESTSLNGQQQKVRK